MAGSHQKRSSSFSHVILFVGMRFTAGRVYAGVATHLDGDVRIVEEGHS